MLQKKLVGVIFMLVALSACGQESLPPDTEIVAAISNSDNYSTHKETFITAAKTLLQNGSCTLHDFKKFQGWVKAEEEYEAKPVYMTYCGGMHPNYRVYLNTESGDIFRL